MTLFWMKAAIVMCQSYPVITSGERSGDKGGCSSLSGDRGLKTDCSGREKLMLRIKDLAGLNTEISRSVCVARTLCQSTYFSYSGLMPRAQESCGAEQLTGFPDEFAKKKKRQKKHWRILGEDEVNAAGKPRILLSSLLSQQPYGMGALKETDDDDDDDDTFLVAARAFMWLFLGLSTLGMCPPPSISEMEFYPQAERSSVPLHRGIQKLFKRVYVWGDFHTFQEECSSGFLHKSSFSEKMKVEPWHGVHTSHCEFKGLCGLCFCRLAAWQAVWLQQDACSRTGPIASGNSCLVISVQRGLELERKPPALLLKKGYLACFNRD
ncbi:Spermatid-specific manchette-related protein 1 [Varanus komodoensis]|nr:Spermatid-specific manchette-related protein 1 [Varanus komodoensis]